MPSSDSIAEHLDAIARIAFDFEPDWDAVYDGADHDWCGQTSAAVRDYLTGRGIGARVARGGLRGNAHAWVALDDGTIIDATIAQYIDRTDDRSVRDDEVPWRLTADEDVVAVIGRDHPLHGDYHEPPATQ